MGQWAIDFYEKSNGRCPTQEFLDSLPADERPLVINAIKQLRQHGLNLARPQVGYLRDHIRELRVDVRRKRYRILHFIYHRDTFVLLQGLVKKAGKVSDSEINRALEYKQDYESTHS